MRKTRFLVAVALSTATLLSGCATFNDRFYVPGRDPLLTFLGAEFETQREWPAASLPDLRPMRTELIPDRLPPPGVPHTGWPNLGWPPL
ncbi:MAG TPA: hypothetical protein VNG69_09960 [Casimicrobiaceae bacterium]|nr:hypothetical protein [Casimicrobiaceae bacterium]